MNKIALFGVAGNPPNFWRSDFHRERANAPEWLRNIGLDALEIQCTYGVRMPEKRSKLFKKNAKKHKIELSVHAPYYITLGSRDAEKIDNSLNELRKASELAKKLGSQKVIFHLGGAKENRELARDRAIKALKEFEKDYDLDGVYLFPEIAGKVGQLGSLEDILAICEMVKCALPCLDLAHLHARQQGFLRTKKDFAKVIDLVEKRLGKIALKNLHVHLYPVDFGPGGERLHKAFFDKLTKPRQMSMLEKNKNHQKVYFPRYEPFLELMAERNLYPTIICEAKNSQDLGALEMKEFYRNLLQS